MSAFVVDDKTINSVVNFVFSNNQSYDNKYYYCLHPLRELGYLAKEPGKDARFAAKRLGEEMFTLNCDSIEQRYGEGQAKEFRPLDYKFVQGNMNHPASGVYQTLKNIACWAYQCCEGDVMTDGLYKALETVQGNIALQIVKRTKQYELAEWE